MAGRFLIGPRWEYFSRRGYFFWDLKRRFSGIDRKNKQNIKLAYDTGVLALQKSRIPRSGFSFPHRNDFCELCSEKSARSRNEFCKSVYWESVRERR